QDNNSIAYAPGAIALPFTKAFPGSIETSTRMYQEGFLVEHGDVKDVERFWMVDPTFFDVFDFGIVAGDRAGTFSDFTSVTITERIAKKYFGAYKANTVTAPKPRQEIQQKGLRRITVEAKAKLPYLVMGYKAPTTATADEPWEVYALEMLANILDGGDSARFAQRLRRGQEIATRVGAGYDMHTRDSHLFLFDGVPTEKHNVADLEAAIRKEINELKTHLASRIEMDRIKTKVIANKVYERDSMFYMAMQIGTLETVHLSHDLLDQYVKNIKAVTAKQIREVARKYLVDENLTVAVLKPQPVK
ncbi:MAG: insulinase family protein, partial [Gammaproteobacteria bacterium]|nr:insulinase family protein [Gammaproteobacteria bacterium]